MKKIILTIIFAVIAIVSMAQYRPVFVVADTSTAFGKTLSDRTLIYCAADSTIYATNGYNSSTKNINTGSVIRIAGGSLSVVVDTAWKRVGDLVSLVNTTDSVMFGSGASKFLWDATTLSASGGGDNYVSGNYSFLWGDGDTTVNDLVYLFGLGLKDRTFSQFVTGQYNDTTPSYFSVAAGRNQANRFNALDVMKDSSLHVNGRIVNKVSDTVVNIDTAGITINKIPTSVVMIVGELDSINITHNPQIDTSVSVGTMIELIGNDDTNVVRFENGDGLVIGGTGYIRLGENDVATFRRIKGKGWILTNFQDN